MSGIIFQHLAGMGTDGAGVVPGCCLFCRDGTGVKAGMYHLEGKKIPLLELFQIAHVSLFCQFFCLYSAQFRNEDNYVCVSCPE